MNLGIRALARKVKCQRGEFGAIMQSKARGTRSGKEGCFGGPELGWFDQDVDVVADEIRQVFVIAKDQKGNAALLPGTKNGGNELADFFLLGRLRHKVEKFRVYFPMAETRARTRLGSTGLEILPPRLSEVPTIKPSASGRKSRTFATITPLPRKIFAEGQARRTRSRSESSAAMPVPMPEMMSASAKPRSSVSRALSSMDKSPRGTACLTRMSAKIWICGQSCCR